MDFPWYSFWLRWEAKEVEEKENFQHPRDALMMWVLSVHMERLLTNVAFPVFILKLNTAVHKNPEKFIFFEHISI